MWLIKLPFKLLMLPVMAVVAVFSIFYKLALHLSSFAVGIVYLVLGLCIVVALLSQAWTSAAIVFVFAALVFLAVMFAELISLGLDALTGMLSGFIFS